MHSHECECKVNAFFSNKQTKTDDSFMNRLFFLIYVKLETQNSPHDHLFSINDVDTPRCFRELLTVEVIYRISLRL